LTSSGGEENDDEDVSFSEPPLDDEDDESLARPSSGFSPSPRPLTSSQKPQEQKVDGKKIDQKQTGRIIVLQSFAREFTLSSASQTLKSNATSVCSGLWGFFRLLKRVVRPLVPLCYLTSVMKI